MELRRPAVTDRRREHAAHHRCGMALILVLALITMTLGVSYAIVRTQTAGLQTATNVRTARNARQAALTGLSAGLRRISQTSWGGVGSTITGNVGAAEQYSVTFTEGDASLTTTSADAADWPYRMTVTATGFAADPTSTGVTTSYKVEAVVRLVPKQLPPNPPQWSSMLGYVFYQSSSDGNSVQLPVQINGSQRWNGTLSTFLTEYPTTHQMRQQYLSDLNAMRFNGYGDCRPFTGQIVTLTAAMSSTNRNYLTSNLGLSLTNSSSTSTTNWSHPGSVTTYKLFPGGTDYTVPTLGSSVSSTTLQADPRTNPAGLFYRNGDVAIGSNTTVVGTIIASGKITLSGAGIALQPVSLAPLTGTSIAPQLPSAVAGSDFRIAPGSDATVRGVVASFANFVGLSGSGDSRLDLQGNLIARALDVQKRTDLDLGSFWWSLIWSGFNGQSGSSPIQYFPVYCQAVVGMPYAPLIKISGPDAPSVRQWFTNGTPVYAVGSGDAGLVWSVLRVRELH